MGIFNKKQVNKVTINNKPLKCVICEHDTFGQSKVHLNKASSTFFGLDWLDQSGICFICNNCGYIHWFYPEQKMEWEKTIIKVIEE